MKTYSFLSIILFLIGNLAFGQDEAISEFDLYGCWIMEGIVKKNEPQKRMYAPCDLTDGKNTIKHKTIVFGDNNKCEFPAVIQDAICPVIYRNVEGSWKYDKESRIVKVYYPKDFRKEFYEAFKEEHPEVEIPNPMMNMQFKIIGLDNGKLIIEKVMPARMFN